MVVVDDMLYAEYPFTDLDDVQVCYDRSNYILAVVEPWHDVQ